MSDMREKLADIINTECHDSVHGGITGAHDAADAILASLPDMVPELEWEPVNDSGPCIFMASSPIGSYFLSNDEDSGLGKQVVEFSADPHSQWHGVTSTIAHDVFDDLNEAASHANTHHRQQLIKALGLA